MGSGEIERVSDMSYNDDMNATIRNIDGKLYLELKARAAREGRTIGAVLNDAIRSYLGGTRRGRRKTRFLDLEPVDFGPGNERLSEEIDEVVYRGKR